MGISDRRYMADSEGSFGSFRGRQNSASITLIAINVAVWIAWLVAQTGYSATGFMYENFTCSRSGVFEHYRVWTLLTYAISHQDFQHIFFNMLFLWILAPDVEIFYGKKNMLALYVVGALASALAQLGTYQWRGTDGNMLGASGSVMCIAATAAFIDPQKPVYLLGLLPVRLWMLVTIYILGDVSGLTQPRSGDYIAHAAHLGGAAMGILFYKLDLRVFPSRGRKSSGLLYQIGQWWRRRKFRVIEGQRAREREIPPDDRELVATRRPRTRRAESAERHIQSEGAVRIDPETARRVDELLAKISREGMDALSSEEQEFLKQSSQKYRK